MPATGYGVTPAGFVAKPLSVTEDETDAGLKRILGDSAGTEPDGSIPLGSFAGQLKSLIVDAISAQWDLMQAIYASKDANQAGGASLEVVSALTGTTKQGAVASIATGTCVGTILTVLPAGRVAATADTGALFSSQDVATLTAALAWVASHTYGVTERVANAGNVYQCTASGVSALTIGPSGTASSIADGSATWRFLGVGSGVADVSFAAQETGPVGALAGRLTDIRTPVSGWNALINLLDAEVGQDEDTDSELRARREAELAGAGNTTRDAIRANVLRVNEGSTDPNHEPPVACEVFFNDTDLTDANGLPPHSVEVLVQGGTTADIAQEIWNSVGAGTVTYGSTTSTVLDSEGNSQTVRWTRPTEVPIWVIATARYDASEWPSNSDARVAQAALSALLTFTEDFPIKRDVRLSPLAAAFLRGPSETNDSGNAVVPAADDSPPVPGLLEMDPLYFGTATGPTASTQITISSRQIATFASTRCTITASTEEP